MDITATIRTIRAKMEAGKFPKYPRFSVGSIGASFWPTHPSASNHFTLGGTKWNSDMHPKD